jgi:hypothetical protein
MLWCPLYRPPNQHIVRPPNQIYGSTLRGGSLPAKNPGSTPGHAVHFVSSIFLAHGYTLNVILWRGILTEV